jgi:D-arabinose 1-dehydrogenase-like Zn-dependent alcohol dehydrogenase
MTGEWRDWTYAEYAKVPLENCHPLDEERLLGKVENGGLGYEIEDVANAMGPLVPYGGLVDIRLQPGETIIIAPATGLFGGRAVEVALAMGARVSRLSKEYSAGWLPLISTGYRCGSKCRGTGKACLHE